MTGDREADPSRLKGQLAEWLWALEQLDRIMPPDATQASGGVMLDAGAGGTTFAVESAGGSAWYTVVGDTGHGRLMLSRGDLAAELGRAYDDLEGSEDDMVATLASGPGHWVTLRVAERSYRVPGHDARNVEFPQVPGERVAWIGRPAFERALAQLQLPAPEEQGDAVLSIAVAASSVLFGVGDEQRCSLVPAWATVTHPTLAREGAVVRADRIAALFAHRLDEPVELLWAAGTPATVALRCGHLAIALRGLDRRAVDAGVLAEHHHVGHLVFDPLWLMPALRDVAGDLPRASDARRAVTLTLREDGRVTVAAAGLEARARTAPWDMSDRDSASHPLLEQPVTFDLAALTEAVEALCPDPQINTFVALHVGAAGEPAIVSPAGYAWDDATARRELLRRG
jgi:hypothetical protein